MKRIEQSMPIPKPEDEGHMSEVRKSFNGRLRGGGFSSQVRDKNCIQSITAFSKGREALPRVHAYPAHPITTNGMKHRDTKVFPWSQFFLETRDRFHAFLKFCLNNALANTRWNEGSLRHYVSLLRFQ
ncbi:MAG: hypothetical protein HOH33_07920 [Verrucomicrobia bacterium]|nr:hypothetical protein [Verrucomicrobiota bacterium]